jgi:ribose transport system ATP-binding protein
MIMAQPILSMCNISKSFPGVQALDDVQMSVLAGEVHALLGENGAGKSTLVKILSGVYRAESGQISVNNKAVVFTSTREAERAGIAIIYQELNLVPEMSVAENIFLGREPKNKLGLIDYKKMKAAAKAELEQLGTDIPVDRHISDLRIGEQQLVEIAKALSLHAKILIMDEPTSALAEGEADRLFDVIRRLQKAMVAIIYITHKLAEIFTIAQKVTVLRDGKYIGTRDVQGVTQADLINMMVGRELSDFFPKVMSARREELLRVENLTVKHPDIPDRLLLNDIHFTLYKGEILGIAGLMGAGRTELLRMLFGLPPGKIISGKIFIKGIEIQITSPVVAIRNAIAFLTEDRKTQGLFLQQSIQFNISITNLKKMVYYWILRRQFEKSIVQQMVQNLHIKAPNQTAIVEKLSGGNQQKIILAKWMLTEPEILLLDDPTRGIDVGAKAEIYQLLNQYTAKGMGIVMASSELPEVMAMSDRILVINQGRFTAEFTRDNVSEHEIMSAATQS